MNTSKLVDELGMLHAAISELRCKANRIKAQLVEAGPGAYEGNVFRATVSVAEKSWLDREALDLAVELAAFSPQYITAHTEHQITHPVRVVAKVEGRKAA